MAEQELDRAASDTITERAVEALANARLSSQIPVLDGNEPSSTKLIRVLVQLVQSTSHVLRWGDHGDHVSIEPNPVMHQYTRAMLKQYSEPMLYIAFGSTAQSRKPWDLSARSNAIDVMRSLELVPDAAIVTRYASQLVDLLCVEEKFEQYEQYSMFLGGGERWLYNVLDVLPPQILAQHAGAIVALVKRGSHLAQADDNSFWYQADKVLFGILLFRKMPPSIIAEHASTFLDVMEDDSQYGEHSCNLEAAMEVLKAMDPTMLGVSCLARLRLMFANTEIDDDQIWELIEKIEPASIAERVDLVVTCLSVGRYERVRKWGISTLSESTIEEYADVIAAAAVTRLDDFDTVQIAALETLSRLPPASLAIHSDAIAACLSPLEGVEVQWAALEALSKLTPGVLLRHKDALASLHYDSPPKKKTLVKERHPDEPTLADVKARARKMHDELYEPGAPGFEAAKASFEALAL